MGSCFLPPFNGGCSGLPSGCGSCIDECSPDYSAPVADVDYFDDVLSSCTEETICDTRYDTIYESKCDEGGCVQIPRQIARDECKTIEVC